MENTKTYNGRPCSISKIQIGATLFTVISVESANAKGTAYDKVKRLILNNTSPTAKTYSVNYPKV